MSGESSESVLEAPGPLRIAGPLYQKLPPGPGRNRREVAAKQRARLHGAMIEAVAESGYRGVRVRSLCALAGVSTRTFYDHFADKEECLIGTYKAIVCRATERVRLSLSDGEDPRERLRLAFEALVDGIVGDPAAARLALIEAPAAGPRAAAAVRRGEASLSSLVAECFEGGGEAVPPPRLFARGIVAGATHVLRERMIEGEPEEVPSLVEELADWAYACGSDAAGALAALGIAPIPTPTRLAHPLAPAEKPGDERAMILAATTRLAVEEGYEGLSVPRIRAAAGVSRKSFDSHFADLDDCFLTACAVVARRALAAAAREAADADRWATGMQQVLLALLAQIVREPVQARLALLEVMSPGPEGIRMVARLVSDAASLLLTTVPKERRPGELAVKASVGAVWEIVSQQVAEGGLRQLHRLVPALNLLLAAPIRDMRTNTEEIGSDRPHATGATG